MGFFAAVGESDFNPVGHGFGEILLGLLVLVALVLAVLLVVFLAGWLVCWWLDRREAGGASSDSNGAQDRQEGEMAPRSR